jgi:hypothetical protein
MTKEEIRNKWIYQTPRISLKEAVDKCLDKYAKQEAIEFTDWKDEHFTVSSESIPFFFAYKSSKYYKEPVEYYTTEQLFKLFKGGEKQ